MSLEVGFEISKAHSRLSMTFSYCSSAMPACMPLCFLSRWPVSEPLVKCFPNRLPWSSVSPHSNREVAKTEVKGMRATQGCHHDGITLPQLHQKDKLAHPL